MDDNMNSYPGKRALDVLAAGTACAVFAPVVVGVTLAVWLEDGRPPLFSQSRVGQGRNPFTLLKFRSMRNAHVTRVGNWLRRTGIDELPQFVNVVRGEMSVVGPRPLTSQDVERLGWAGPDHDWRFAAKPGITGLSQLLAGRGARSSERLDRLYLRRQSLLLDLQLIALSFAVNIAGKSKVRRFLRRTLAERSLRSGLLEPGPSSSPQSPV
jgi:undecaprenyl phosphate N,N'-diacetylbacillosamine 1-phosphate transferase